MSQRWLVFSASGEHLSDVFQSYGWAVAAYAEAALKSESWDGWMLVKWEGDNELSSRRDVAAFVHGRLIWEDNGYD